MGYLTNYDLTMDNHGKKNEEDYQNALIAAKVRLEEISMFKFAGTGDCLCLWECKWYEHDEDMLKLSLEFPYILFTLHGDGEDSEDMWYTYYLNGKMQEDRAQIVYNGFDERLLE